MYGTIAQRANMEEKAMEVEKVVMETREVGELLEVDYPSRYTSMDDERLVRRNVELGEIDE